MVSIKTGAWTPEEDVILAAMQKKVGNHWSTIAQHIEGRTGQQCAQRWRHKVNPNIRKDKWTEEEDLLLEQLVQKFGTRWAEIARRCNGRTDQQCMGRWRRHLDPGIKRDQWTQAEDKLLVKLQRVYPRQWSRVSQDIPGRTAQQCRARFFQVHDTSSNSCGSQYKRRRSSLSTEDFEEDLEDEEPIETKPSKKQKQSKARAAKKAPTKAVAAASAPPKKRKKAAAAAAAAPKRKSPEPRQAFSATSDQSTLGDAEILPPSVVRPIKPEARLGSPPARPWGRDEETSALSAAADAKFLTPKKEEQSRMCSYSYSPPPPYSGGIPLYTKSPYSVGGGADSSPPFASFFSSPLGPLASLSPLMWQVSPSHYTPAGFANAFPSGCTTPGSSVLKSHRSASLHIPTAMAASPYATPPAWSQEFLQAPDSSRKEQAGVKRRLSMSPAFMEGKGSGAATAAATGDSSSPAKGRNCDVPIKPLGLSGSERPSAFHKVHATSHAELLSAVSDGCATPMQLQQHIAHSGRPSLTPITSASMSAGTTLFANGRPSICSVNDLDKEALAAARRHAERRLSTAGSTEAPAATAAAAAAPAALPIIKETTAAVPSSPVKLEVVGVNVMNKENSNPGRGEFPGSSALSGASASPSLLRGLAAPQGKNCSSGPSEVTVAHSRSRIYALLSLEEALA